MTKKRAVVVAAVMGLLAAACGGDEGTDDAASTTATPATTTVPDITTAPDATTEEPPAVDDAFPVTITNCGLTLTFDEPPARAVTMNQAATEIMLALGLEDHLVGTAYLDDEILPEFADAYATIAVLADEYPSSEVLLEVEPDFIYGSYASAFGEEAAGDRETLMGLGIGSLLSGPACPDFRASGEPATFDMVMQEIRDVAAIFGVVESGEALIAEQEKTVADAAFAADGGISVLWWDGGLDAPTVGACCGAPGLLMRALALDNIFDEVSGGWAEVNWEEVVATDPDVIVLVDASWDPAADKEAHLRADRALADLTAVVNDRLVVIPFSATTPGIRVAPALGELGEAIRALDLDQE